MTNNFIKVGGLFKRASVTSNGKRVLASKKTIVRERIAKEVMDTEDALSDALKWASLLTSMIGVIWDTMPEDQKATIPVDQRQLIEATINKFRTTETRADIALEHEGFTVIERMLTNQGKIGQITKDLL